MVEVAEPNGNAAQAVEEATAEVAVMATAAEEQVSQTSSALNA